MRYSANFMHYGFGLVILIILVFVAIYLYSSYCLYVIAKKTNTQHAWLSYIPIINTFYILHVARMQWWMMVIFGLSLLITRKAGILSLIPVIILAVAWFKISVERRRPSWWGILAVIPIVNWIIFYLLAFKEAPNAVAPISHTPPSETPPTPPIA